MGSLFYINIPTREREVCLRKRDLNVWINYNGSRVKDLLGAAAQWKSCVTGNALDPRVEVYEGTVGGVPAKIVLSKDQFATYTIKELTSQPPWLDHKDREFEKIQNLVNNTLLEKHVEEALIKFEISDAAWGASVDRDVSQVSFVVQASRTQEILTYMRSLGVGTKYNSTLCVCAANAYYNPDSADKEEEDNPDSTKNRIMDSIKSKLTVAQVVRTLEDNAVMTFDAIGLILIAGILAVLGLLENSTVYLVASTLISPLLGPVVAGVFGASVRDTKLIKTGLTSELGGLLACFLIGFTFGGSLAWAPFPGPWKELEVWPTAAMRVPGKLGAFATGTMVAVLSGVGVGLSILAGKAGSLVGLAVSASLIPPAVNSGMFWGMATVRAIQEHVIGNIWLGVPLVCEVPHPDNSTEEILKGESREGVIQDFVLMANVSFVMTILNMLLILIVGYGVLKLKEVAPHTTPSRFWKKDLKVMRDHNKFHGPFDEEILLKDIMGSNDSEEIMASLTKDHVYKEVARKMIFGNGIDVLDSKSSYNVTAIGGKEKKARGALFGTGPPKVAVIGVGGK